MPTELGRPFDIYWRGVPEQMLPADVPIWHAYLDKHAEEYLHFFYNVRVGGPDITKIKAEPEMLKMWYAATAKRIDVLGEKPAELWIIEVASSPYLRAVGQCMSYEFLWKEDPKIDKPVKTALICPRLDADITKVLKKYGITIITVQL